MLQLLSDSRVDVALDLGRHIATKLHINQGSRNKQNKTRTKNEISHILFHLLACSIGISGHAHVLMNNADVEMFEKALDLSTEVFLDDVEVP